MAFVDHVVIDVQAGHGGNGSNAVRRLRAKHKRLPQGGAGGKGGDIALVADENTRTLLDLSLQRSYKAASGQQGGSNRRRGRSGSDLEVRVPMGSVVRDNKGFLLRDLVVSNERLIVVRGGRGGSGNARDRRAQPGAQGEKRRLRIELKLIADVGLVGFPNSGKSTLFNALTHARSKVAGYPFSTLRPELGVLENADTYERAILCDIPGLVEGAHRGVGLGDDFLRHIERTRILVHLVEMQKVKGIHPLERLQKIHMELEGYDAKIVRKHRIVVASKMDLQNARNELERFQAGIEERVVPVSAKTGEGLENLKDRILQAARAG